MKNTASYKSYIDSPYRSIKHSTYFEVYDELFLPYRGKDITFVEIGILGGGSLFMWRNFFGAQARIIGIDLNPDAKKWERDGFEIYVGSQSDEAFWQSFRDKIGKIDIVLDDGGHTYEQQITTTEMLLSNINEGGILVIEDTHTSYMDGFGPRKYSFIEYIKNMIDRMNQRFGEFDKKEAENRVWSIRIYESIVAFMVKPTASNLPSKPTSNTDKIALPPDFRYSENSALPTIERLNRKLNKLAFIPGIETIQKKLEIAAKNKGFKAKRFFR